MKDLVTRIFASHKTAIAAVAMSAVGSALTVAYSQLANGHINWRAVALAAAGPVVTAVAGLAKSPLTPAQAPPDDPPPSDKGGA